MIVLISNKLMKSAVDSRIGYIVIFFEVVQHGLFEGFWVYLLRCTVAVE